MSSVHQDSVSRITSLVEALQKYVSANTSSGLNDVASSLEVLVTEILLITEGLKLTNLNLLHSNFPAIDLADSMRGIAIQVTSNVTSDKWKKTVDKFLEHRLDASYNELRIIGFCEAVKPRNMPPYLRVQGPTALLSGLKNLKIGQLKKLESLLRESYDFSRLSPLRDEDCFRVVLNVLDRDAIRHYTCVEGSYPDLVSALKEIKQIITAGSIPAKEIYAKPLSQYSTEYEEILRSVDLNLAQMLAEVARAKRDDYYYLTFEQKKKVDASRSSIICEVNDFCKRHGIAREICGIS